MQTDGRQLRTAALLFVVLLLGLGGGIALDRLVLRPAALPGTGAAAGATPGPDASLLEDAWRLIDRAYVDRPAVQTQTLTYGAISGMVDALGDTGHSRFQTPTDVREEQTLTSGQFEGIGAEVEMKDGHVVVVAPIDGSPAQKAGLRPGDIMLRVEGQNVDGLPLNTVVSRVLGPAGTTVHLTVLTPATGQTRDLTLVRARITIHNVTWQRLPGTSLAHVRIAEFSQGVSRDLRTALDAVAQQHLTGIVLDLRNDPGGLLDEAIATASTFLPSGNVLLEKNAQGKVTDVPVQPAGAPVTLPLVVLVNEGSASASEIVAGALQDAHRGRLVGATTFGTGTVLQEFPLRDGSALLLATEEWLTPQGRVIWHHGIVPDEAVALPPPATPLVPEAETGLTAAQLQAAGDAPLLRAIAILGTAPAK